MQQLSTTIYGVPFCSRERERSSGKGEGRKERSSKHRSSKDKERKDRRGSKDRYRGKVKDGGRESNDAADENEEEEAQVILAILLRTHECTRRTHECTRLYNLSVLIPAFIAACTQCMTVIHAC
jgi:hypothetical protein